MHFRNMRQHQDHLLDGAHLHNQHEDEDEDEGSVEVGDVEGCAKAPDQSVASNDTGQQHGGHLGAQAVNQATQ